MNDFVFPELPKLNAKDAAMKHYMRSGNISLSVAGRRALGDSRYEHGTVEFGCSFIRPSGYANSWVRTNQWEARAARRSASKYKRKHKRLIENFETWEEGYARYMEIRAACVKLFPIVG